jgi:hypothetical protein
VRIKELQNKAHRDFRYSKTLLARLTLFLRKEVAEKEVAKKEAAEKEAAENPVARVIFIMSYI